ncbi:MAG: glutamyl-tRNA reductase, partial [Acidimicrobiales bacterium]
IGPEDLAKALADLASRPHLDEVVVLSTCERTEVYTLANRFHGAVADITEFLSGWSGQPPEDFSDSLYSYFDEQAVGHLFRVSAGLDSASLGEPEILGQVRRAWEVAHDEGTAGPALAAVFRHALEAGKRARTETSISRGTTSLSHAAVEIATSVLGGLDGKQALVLGLGEIGDAAARAFAKVPGAKPVLVANRTAARSKRLALSLGGEPVQWDRLVPAVADADVVVCCASGAEHVLSASDVRAAVSARAGRPLVLVDLAVPRGVDPAIGTLDGARLFDMDDISRFVSARLDARQAEVPVVERLLAEELDRFSRSMAERTVTPLVSMLREKAEKARLFELARLDGWLAGQGPEERAMVDALTRRLVAKLIHGPMANLKAAAGTPQGETIAQAFRELFDLDEP